MQNWINAASRSNHFYAPADLNWVHRSTNMYMIELMVCTAVLYGFLRLSRGIGSCILSFIWVHHDTQCSSLGSLVFAHLGSI